MSAPSISGRGAFSRPRDTIGLYQTDHALLEVDAIKPGDQITVRVAVASVTRGVHPCFNIGGTGGRDSLANAPCWIAAKQIVAHHPMPEKDPEVGDDVIAPDGNGHGVIRAIVDGKAWVRFAPTILETYKLAELKRIVIVREPAQ